MRRAVSKVVSDVALVALVISFAVTAHAQEVEPVGVQEVVVTAQKRSDNVQNVPISISTFGSDSLNERAVLNASQLATLVPNMQLA